MESFDFIIWLVIWLPCDMAFERYISAVHLLLEFLIAAINMLLTSNMSLTLLFKSKSSLWVIYQRYTPLVLGYCEIVPAGHSMVGLCVLIKHIQYHGGSSWWLHWGYSYNALSILRIPLEPSLATSIFTTFVVQWCFRETVWKLYDDRTTNLTNHLG